MSEMAPIRKYFQCSWKVSDHVFLCQDIDFASFQNVSIDVWNSFRQRYIGIFILFVL
jgi:hypothetical protein